MVEGGEEERKKPDLFHLFSRDSLCKVDVSSSQIVTWQLGNESPISTSLRCSKVKTLEANPDTFSTPAKKKIKTNCDDISGIAWNCYS